MSTTRLFGTDGIRGVANSEPMTPETVVRIGKAVAAWCSTPGRSSNVVVGRDTRQSGSMIEAALASGMAAAGVDVALAGEIPTPAVAFLTRGLRAAAGAVVSASHNPFRDNGVKLFGADGFKPSDSEEAEIETLVADSSAASCAAEGVGRIRTIDDAAERYQQYLIERLPDDFRLDGMKIVLDCAHGAAYRVGPEVFGKLGTNLTTLGASPDGININDRHGALHPERTQKVVRDTGADLGIALDGDADRVVLVDRQGAVVDGDEMLAILLDAAVKAGTAGSRVAVGTVMSNMGLENALRERDVRFVRAQVGDRHVVDEMRRLGATIGGEPSGHIVLLDHHTTGDGLLAALAICRVMRESGRELADLRRVMCKFPQAMVNVRVQLRRELRDLAPLQDAIAAVERRLGSNGRVLVRASGTEPLVRVMVEGQDESQVQGDAAELAEVVTRCHEG